MSSSGKIGITELRIETSEIPVAGGSKANTGARLC